MNISKYYFTSLVCMLLSAVCFAANAGVSDSVSFVSYEQNWVDPTASVAVKNNTNREIHSMTFRITYYDMNGRQLDYRDYDSDEDIDPGMTKKIEIDAYENMRGYSYYKSRAGYAGSHRFKVSFQLLNCNFDEDDGDVYGDDDYATKFDAVGTDVGTANRCGAAFFSGFGVLLTLSVLLFCFGVCVSLYVLVAVMAQKRGRSAALWVLVAIVGSPLLAIVVLLLVGRSTNGNIPLH